jgi:hypothetical protein
MYNSCNTDSPFSGLDDKKGKETATAIRLAVCLDLAGGQGTFRHGTCVVIYLIFLSCSLSLYVPPQAKTWVSCFQQENTTTRTEAPKDDTS